jgi:ribosomal protein S18 acetylase RimI-like enzyme
MAEPARIERLAAGGGPRLRALRLRALADAPAAFSTTYAQAAARPRGEWESQLERMATFVATAGGADIGLVRGVQHDRLADAGYLISMWVAPEARRQGVGSALIGAVVRWARARGFGRLVLEVGESNSPAIALYRRAGFAAEGVVAGEIQMVMKL